MVSVTTVSKERTRGVWAPNRRMFLAGCAAASGGWARADHLCAPSCFSVLRVVAAGPAELCVMGRSLGEPIAVGDRLWAGSNGSGKCCEIRTRDGFFSELPTGAVGILRLRGLPSTDMRHGSLLTSHTEDLAPTPHQARVKSLENRTKLQPGACEVLITAACLPAEIAAVDRDGPAGTALRVALLLPGHISANLAGSLALAVGGEIVAAGKLIPHQPSGHTTPSGAV